MAMLPWQQVQAPNNQAAASFMSLAMEGAKQAGNQLQGAAQQAAGIFDAQDQQKRDRAAAMLSGQLMNVGSSEERNQLMASAIESDPNLYNPATIDKAQSILEGSLANTTSQQTIDYNTEANPLKVRSLSLANTQSEQNIEEAANRIADYKTQKIMDVLQQNLTDNFALNGVGQSDEELNAIAETMIEEMGLGREEANRVRATLAGNVGKLRTQTQLQHSANIEAGTAAKLASDIENGKGITSNSAVIEALDSKLPSEITGNFVKSMTLGATGKDLQWDKSTTGANTPAEWEGVVQMYAANNQLTPGQLQMVLNSGFRNIKDENGFNQAANVAKTNYAANKRLDAQIAQYNNEKADLARQLAQAEIRMNALTSRSGSSADSVKSAKDQVDEYKNQLAQIDAKMLETQMSRWVDPIQIEADEKKLREQFANNKIKGKEPITSEQRVRAVERKPNEIVNLLFGRTERDLLDAKSKEIAKAEVSVSNLNTLNKWAKGFSPEDPFKPNSKPTIPDSEVNNFRALLSSDGDIMNTYKNWYDNVISEAANGNKGALRITQINDHFAIREFMTFYASSKLNNLPSRSQTPSGRDISILVGNAFNTTGSTSGNSLKLNPNSILTGME